MSERLNLVKAALDGLGAAGMVLAAFPNAEPSVTRPAMATAVELPGRDGVAVFLDVTVRSQPGDEKAHRLATGGAWVQYLSGNFWLPREVLALATPDALAKAVVSGVEATLGKMRAVGLCEQTAVAEEAGAAP